MVTTDGNLSRYYLHRLGSSQPEQEGSTLIQRICQRLDRSSHSIWRVDVELFARWLSAINFLSPRRKCRFLPTCY